jgi:hypothetical protein
MENKNYSNMMAEEIARRLESKTWNLQTADGVLRRRKSHARFTLLTSLSTAAVAAAAIAVLFLFALKTETTAPNYNRFIAQQLMGTANYVQGKTQKIPQTVAPIHEVILQNNIDSIIDETLAMR